MSRLSYCVLPVLVILFGCAAQQPYSIMDGAYIRSPDISSYDVLILGIDGKHYGTHHTRIQLKPGVHQFYLASAKLARDRPIEQPVLISGQGAVYTNASTRHMVDNRVWYKSYTIELAPCMRYILRAEHSNLLDNKNWELKIEREPIPACEKLVAEAKAKAATIAATSHSKPE